MKVKYHILLFLIISFFAQACDDDETKTPNRDELKITASDESVILNLDDPSQNILTFSWNKATNIGEEYTFSYLFQIDISDNNFATATEYITLDENGSYSFTSAELYDLIVEKWGQTAGQQVTIEARVAAKVDGPKFIYPEIATTKVQVTTYMLQSYPLFMMGTATDAGSDPAKAIMMNELSNGRIYDWTGKLKVGNIKFITTLGSLYPAYEKGENGNTLILVEQPEAGRTASYFEITEAGTYHIHLSKKDMSISFNLSKFEALYVIGDACDAGWDFSKTMTQDKNNLNIYTFQGALKAGELKIIAGTDWNDPTFRPLVANGNIESEEVQYTTSGDDFKWKVTAEQAGNYIITLDVELPKITFTKQ